MVKSRGFTLMELMIVVVVIAILATIAISSYTEQVRRGKRAEAKQAITDMQLREEKFRADNPTYGNTTDASAVSPLANLLGSVGAVTNYNSGLKYYTIKIENNTATAYKITATRKGDLANDPKCGNFTLAYSNGTSTQGVSSGDKNYCWGH